MRVFTYEKTLPRGYIFLAVNNIQTIVLLILVSITEIQQHSQSDTSQYTAHCTHLFISKLGQ